jgi:carboxypeptidase Taq
MSTYLDLAARFERHYLLRSAADMLEWDAQTLMPAGSGDLRAAQLGTLRVLAHEAIAAPAVADLLSAAEASPPEGEWERANVASMRREWVHAAAVPSDLVDARTRAASACELAWRTARKDDDFASLLPKLREILNLTRQMGQAKSAALGTSVYDALIDEYEPGVREAFLTPLFARLETDLPPLVERILEAQRALPPAAPLGGPFPVAQQAALGRVLAGRIGFDFTRGRMDVSVHPFCGGASEDVRITTRYDERDFLSSVMGTVHESGHAMYEANLPRAWVRQPVGHAIGMAMHESQSLIIEMQASRTREFLGYLAGIASEHFGVALSAADLTRHALHVERGLIRVDADEATYPLHVIVRYRLERALLGGDLDVADLPGAFRDAMERIVGVRPDTDRNGCLQDVHWPSGAFGYFPSYTLGAMAAAQLFAAAKQQFPAIPDELSRGEFTSLQSFLRTHVHEMGSRYDTNTVLEKATGKKLGAESLLAHLHARYL